MPLGTVFIHTGSLFQPYNKVEDTDVKRNGFIQGTETQQFILELVFFILLKKNIYFLL